MEAKNLLLVAACLMPIISFAQNPSASTTLPSAGASTQPTQAVILTAEEQKIISSFRGEDGELPASQTSVFAATVANTNFIIPIIRFNTINDYGAATNNKKGNVSFFNSIGAGVSINWGRLSLTTDKDSKIINREMDNTVGVQLGFLFAANTGTDNNVNIFAPTISASVLNFQLGAGYELGTLPTTDNRVFYTLAYAIPIAKLVRGGFYVLRRTPLPLNPKSGFFN